MQNKLISLDAYIKLGLTNLLQVFWYRLKLKTGIIRKQLPIGKSYTGDFFSIPVQLPQHNLSSEVVSHADALLNGQQTFFSHQSVELGAPPNWSAMNSVHWSQIGDFDSGDIKLVWELSRFDWVVIFARAYRVSGDKKYLKALNSWLVDWIKKNPFNQGPNWKCGQEAAIRMMQLLLAAKLLNQQPNECLIRFVSEHCQRIASTLAYAMAQNNNHGTSEAAALFIGGSWLEKHNKKAIYWQTIGRRWLENRAKSLIETDGSFSQYSLNYHRVMLDTFWMVEFWRKQLDKKAFSEEFYKRAKMATNWLYQMLDLKTGDAPNLGHNDGARLFLLTETDYQDFRPTVQLASVLFYGKPLFSLQHKVSEGLYWLDLYEHIKIENEPPLKQQSQLFKGGGYAVLQKNNTKAIIRFPSFRFRPSQADALHMDLWHKGHNILRDSGSYSYNTEEKWLKYFSGTRSHNTIEFDDRDQMPKVSRFLFGKWLTTNLLSEIEEQGNQLSWSASYTDYKGCSHYRQVSASANTWKIIDKISGNFNKAVLRWRLMPEQWIIKNNICQSEKAKIEIICDVDIQRLEITEGWESRYYLEKTALPVLEIEIAARTSAIFTTIITLN